MSYLSKPTSTNNYGVVKIGSGISVANGIISVAGGGSSIVGTWNPTITSSLGATITLTINTANYVKNGQQVICYFDFTVTTETNGGNSGVLTLNGLPFTSISGTGIVGSLIVTYIELLDTNQSVITGTISGASTQILLWANRVAPSSSRLLQSDIKPTSRLAGTITYLSSN